MSWTDRAACTGANPNVFFPTTDDPDNHGRTAKASTRRRVDQRRQVVAQIQREPFQDRRVGLDVTEERVAPWTQQATDLPGCVAMVDGQLLRCAQTEQASSVLRGAHRFDLFKRQAVEVLDPVAALPRTVAFKVQRSTTAKPRVAFVSVLHGVDAGSIVGTRPAVRPVVLARFAEHVEWKNLGAVPALLRFHALSLTYLLGIGEAL